MTVGIKQKFLLLAGVVAIILTAVSIIGYTTSHSNLSESVENEGRATVDIQGRAVDGWLQQKSVHALDAAELMARFNSTGTLDHNSMMSMMQIAHDDKDIMALTHCDENGVVVSDTDDLTGKLEIRTREWYKRVKAEGKLIFTGQLDDLFNDQFGALPYRSVDMKFETVETESYQPAATVNYPNNYDFTRITEFKKIHPVKTPSTTILKEYPQDYERGVNTPYYPIFTDDNKARFDQYAQKAAQIKKRRAQKKRRRLIAALVFVLLAVLCAALMLTLVAGPLKWIVLNPSYLKTFVPSPAYCAEMRTRISDDLDHVALLYGLETGSLEEVVTDEFAGLTDDTEDAA